MYRLFLRHLFIIKTETIIGLFNVRVASIIQALGLADILFIFNIDGSAKSYSLSHVYKCQNIETR